MKRQSGTFTALGNDHQIYTIFELTFFEDTRSYDNSLRAEIPGSKDFLTSDGEPVDWKEKGVYQIVTTGVLLRKRRLNKARAPRERNKPRRLHADSKSATQSTVY